MLGGKIIKDCLYGCPGQDCEYGLYAIHGARLGCYPTSCTDWDSKKANNYSSLSIIGNLICMTVVTTNPDYYKDIVDMGQKILQQHDRIKCRTSIQHKAKHLKKFI